MADLAIHITVMNKIIEQGSVDFENGMLVAVGEYKPGHILIRMSSGDTDIILHQSQFLQNLIDKCEEYTSTSDMYTCIGGVKDCLEHSCGKPDNYHIILLGHTNAYYFLHMISKLKDNEIKDAVGFTEVGKNIGHWIHKIMIQYKVLKYKILNKI